MHASRLFRDFLTLVLVVGRFAAPASAQEAPVELSGGYQLFSLEPGQDQNTQTLRTGWYIDLAGNLTRVFAVVGQVGGNYRSRDLLGNEVRFSMHEFMGGPPVEWIDMTNHSNQARSAARSAIETGGIC